LSTCQLELILYVAILLNLVKSSLCSRSVPWLDEGLNVLLPYMSVLRYVPFDVDHIHTLVTYSVDLADDVTCRGYICDVI